MKPSPHALAAALACVFGACSSSETDGPRRPPPAADPCDGVDCSGHGTCSVIADEPSCDCEPGYAPQGTSCVFVPACLGVDCGAHGTCVASGSGSSCACDTGYTGPTCAACAGGYVGPDTSGLCNPSCATANPTCPAHHVCDDSSGTAACVHDGWGFADEGLVVGTARTNYDALDEGTAANPLTFIPCLYQQPDPLLIDPPGCNSGPAVFSQSNAWTNGLTWPTDDYWVLLMNNEPAFNTCNSGPPDNSLPRSAPGQGIMGFEISTAAGESFKRAHLHVANDGNPCGAGAIPFLSFGAHQHRGNRGRPILALHPSPTSARPAPTHLEFTVKLEGISISDGDAGRTYLWTVASWPRQSGAVVPRMLFLELGIWSRIPGWQARRLQRHWSWPIGEDFLQPGADIAFLDAQDAREFCHLDVPALYLTDDIVVGREITYDIDVSRLYDCASDLGLFDEPLSPAAVDVPVHTVFFASEVARAGSSIWTSFHGLRTYRSPCGGSCGPGETCNGGACVCGSAPACTATQYCYQGACYARPTLVQDPVCADLGVAHPSPGYLTRYTVYGRPGATVQKYNRHLSCFGPTELGGESPLTVAPDGTAVFSFSHDAGFSDCQMGILGRYESHAVVDGIASNIQFVNYYNSQCAGVATCSAADTFCP